MELVFNNIFIVIFILAEISGLAGVYTSKFLLKKIDRDKGMIIFVIGILVTLIMSGLFLSAINEMMSGINIGSTMSEDDVVRCMTMRNYGIFIIPFGIYLIFLGKRLSFRE